MLVTHQQPAAPGCGPPPEVAMLSLWLGTCCCSFPHHSVHAAAAEVCAKRLAQRAVGATPVPHTLKPTVVELLPVGIQRLQENKTWKLWVWPPAAKEQLCMLVKGLQKDLLSHMTMLEATGAVGGLLVTCLCVPRFCRHK